MSAQPREPERSTLTWEGFEDGMARFRDAARSATGWRRRALLAVRVVFGALLLAMAAVFVIGVVAQIF